jgi:hypothetical protein
MRMKTYKKRRKSKSKEEYIIKKMMNKYKVSKKDIKIGTFEGKNNIKYKYYICANKKKLVNYYPTFPPLKPYFCGKNPFGELEHPEVENENTNFE